MEKYMHNPLGFFSIIIKLGNVQPAKEVQIQKVICNICLYFNIPRNHSFIYGAGTPQKIDLLLIKLKRGNK